MVGAAVVPACTGGDPANSGPVTKKTVVGPPPQTNLTASQPADTGRRKGAGGKQIPKSIKQMPNQ
jgi:hypothetical protein